MKKKKQTAESTITRRQLSVSVAPLLRPQIPTMATMSSGTLDDELLAFRPPEEGISDARESTTSCQDDGDDNSIGGILPDRLSTLHDHDCLLAILSFLSWRDLNNFSIVSRRCHEVRRHVSLDQTRSGTILLGNGVSTAKDFLDKAKAERWSEAFCGHRTHLRLFNLTHLSSNIDPINDAFVNTLSPLHHVQSLDCSMTPRFRQSYDHDDEQTSAESLLHCGRPIHRLESEFFKPLPKIQKMPAHWCCLGHNMMRTAASCLPLPPKRQEQEQRRPRRRPRAEQQFHMFHRRPGQFLNSFCPDRSGSL